MKHFADRLIEKIEEVGNYGCLGVDPRTEWTPQGAGDFERELITLADGKLVAVKPQAGFLNDDPRVIQELCAFARFSNMISIADVKRGDIGTTAEGYAETWLRDEGIDAVTLNPYLGADSLEPWVNVAAEEGKGLFVLVRTSNPGANDIQDLTVRGGFETAECIGPQVPEETVCERVARMVDKLGKDYVGINGYSLVGAVVGATVDHKLVSRLRELMPRAIFLMPGMGAQGGSHESIRAALDKHGMGVLAPSSRSLNYPWKRKDGSGAAPLDWREVIKKAIDDFAKSVKVQAKETPESMARTSHVHTFVNDVCACGERDD